MGKLVGRGVEIAAVRAALAAAKGGRGSLIVVHADPGVGRTELLLEAARAARRTRLPVALARCLPGAADIDLDVVRTLGVGMSCGAPAAVEQGPAAAVAATAASLAAAGASGLCLLVDDAHWADESSLRVLLRLALELRALPIVIILSAERGAPAPRALDELRALPGAVILSPAALTLEETTALAEATLGDEASADVARRCHERGAGNPFLVAALLAELPGDAAVGTAVPERVCAVVATRLARCGPEATALARAAHVLGDEVTLSRAASLAGLARRQAEDAADALVRSSVVTSPLLFAAPLLDDAVGAALEPFARERLHRSAAELLAAEDAPASRIGEHLLRTSPAGEEWVAEQLARAAAAASADGDLRHASMLLRRALAEPPSADALPGMLSDLAFAESRAGLPEAPMRIEAGLAAATSADARLRLRREQARLMWLSGRLPDAVRCSEVAVAEAEPGTEIHGLVLAELLAVVSMHDLAAIREHPALDAVLARAGTGWVPDSPALAATLASVLPLAMGDHRLIPALVERALTEDLWRQDGPPHGLRPDFVIGALHLTDEPEQARDLVRHGLGVAAGNGDEVSLGRWTYWLTMAEYALGDLAGTIDAGMRAIAAADSTYGSWLGYTAAAVAHAHLDRGDRRSATEALAITDGRVAPEQLYGMAVDLTRARILLAEGAADRSSELARDVGERLTALGHRDGPLIVWRPLAAEATRAAGDELQSRRLAAEEVAIARATHARVRLGNALRVSAATHGRELRRGVLEEAVGVLRETACRVPLAAALFDLGAELHARGESRAARDPLGEARELAEACGAKPLAASALAALHATGAKPRRIATSGPEALTATERRVVELGIDGLTNREIGSELVITARTVEWHLGRAFDKLGVRSRRDLAAAMGAAGASREALGGTRPERSALRPGRSA